MTRNMYNYQTQRNAIFTEKGQVLFLQVRDHVKELLQAAGAFQMGNVLTGITGSFDTWEVMACVDRLCELREILELERPGCAGQHRTFVERL